MGKNERSEFFKIPQTKSNIKLNIILGIGFLLALLGLVFTIKTFINEKDFTVFWTVFFLVIGEICLFISFAFTKNIITTYAGFLFILEGLLCIFVETPVIDYGFKELWPIAVINFGLAFIPTDIYKYKKLRVSILFSALALIFLGIIFLGFSAKIFPVSFIQFIKKWWPIVLFGFGLILIIIFVIQKNNDKKFPYLEEEEVSFGVDD